MLTLHIQPSFQHNCNPYYVNNEDWRLRLVCEVTLDTGHWFQRNNENKTIDHGRLSKGCGLDGIVYSYIHELWFTIIRAMGRMDIIISCIN